VRAHARVVEAGADVQALGVLGDARDKLVVDVGVDDGARRRGTGLAGDAEGADADDVDCLVDVRAVGDDGRVLPAHLGLGALGVVGRRVVDLEADLRAPGEGDGVDIPAVGQRGTDAATGPDDDVDDAVRGTGLVERLGEFEGRAGRLRGGF